MPSVSVIMNCLNSAKYLREAMDSVYAQTLKDWEIIFWDNASTDTSAAIAKSYDGKVHYFKSESTVPLGKARNLAIEKSSGDYIAFLDCDDIWMPRKLEKQIPLFEKNKNTGLVFCDTVYFNEKGDRYNIYKNYKPPHGNVFRELFTHYFLSMEAVVIRKKALLSLDEWFDETLHVTEEEELFLRMAKQFELDYVDEPLSKWRMHGESWTHSRYHLFPVENEQVLSKFMKKYPDFERDYAREIVLFRKKIHYQKALSRFNEGNAAEARSLLKNYIRKDKRILLFYISTFFPHAWFYAAKKLYSRYRYLFWGRDRT